ncbi:MAG: hypothetical protein AAFP84_11970 [Actinomycetota bacterium]
MDLSNFKTSDWLIAGGGVGFFVFGFFEWITVKADGFNLGGGGNVFDFFWTGTLPWILLIGSAVVVILLQLGTLKPDQLPWPLILLAATGLAGVLMLIRLLFNPIEGSGTFGVEAGRGIGMILSAVSAVVAASGGVMKYTESGGDLKDLTDLDTLKGAFSGGSDDGDASAMPPPPPGSATPPPPAPPAGGGTPPPPPPPSQ